MKAHTIKGKSPEEIQSALREVMSGGYKPTLAIVFLSIQQDIQKVSAVFDDAEIQIFGATTAGEFTDGNIEEGSITAMLLDINPACFKIYFAEAGDAEFFQTGNEIGNYSKEIFSKPQFLVAVANWGASGEMILRGVEAVLDDGVNIYGGIAGDDLTLKGAHVFTNRKETNSGLVLLILDAEKIRMKGIAVSGWKPLGTQRKITKSEGNIVYTIENEPAFDVYQKYLDETTSDLRQGNKFLLQANAYFPILIERKNAPPLVRTGTYTDLEERSVHFAGSVEEGSVFRFSQPPDFEVIDKVISEADQNIKQKEIPDADALILFSCISRRTIFGPMAGEEIEGIKNLWDAPLVGFFGYGEIGRSGDGKNELHNTTCCLVALKENA